ncbi:MAG: hypothetical protein JTT11_04435 [Candidatus Brockarchaeota archaeon]|nr:hypothetical protein [Candidatus Brockarchaeota archaeon]
MSGRSKRIAFFEFGDCGGCELAVIENSKALDLLGKVDIAYWLLLGKTGEGPYDITFVEGVVASEHDIDALKRIREKSGILVALGSDACVSGIPGLRRFANKDKVEGVYGNVELEHKPIEGIGPLDHFVKVDYVLRGCPVNGDQFSRLLELLVEGKQVEQGEKSFDYSKPRFGENAGRAIVLDNEKCILCERCVEVCNGITSALSIADRGINTLITPPFRMGIDGSTCISCGQCTVYCPVSALCEKDSIAEVNRMVSSGRPVDAVVEVETAVSIGEFFGLNERCHGLLVDALKRIGFRNVYLSRSKSRAKFLDPRPVGRFPAIIPCCYSAKKFVETYYPRLRQSISQPPKPSFKADVWIGPCTGRKIDSEMVVLTTREVSRMIRDYLTTKYIEFNEFDDVNFDDVELREPEIVGRVIAEGAFEIRQVLDKAMRGELQGAVVELWACPKGCISGGGQYKASEEILARRKEWIDGMGSALWRTRWWARSA